MRSIALGEQERPSFGPDSGGDRKANIDTLIGTAKRNGINPEAYRRDVTERVADHTASRLNERLTEESQKFEWIGPSGGVP